MGAGKIYSARGLQSSVWKKTSENTKLCIGIYIK